MYQSFSKAAFCSSFESFDQSEMETPPVKILGSEKFSFIVKKGAFSCTVRKRGGNADIKNGLFTQSV